jgi:hypothetical protein
MPSKATKRHLLDVRALNVFKRLQTRCGRSSPEDKDAILPPLKTWTKAVDLAPKPGHAYCRSCEKNYGNDNGREEVEASGLKEVPGVAG